MNSTAAEMFNPNVPAIIGGIAWVLFVAYMLGRNERKRLGIVALDYDHHTSLNDEQRSFRRPKLILVNAAMTVALIITLMMGWIPAPVLFVIASCFALLINAASTGVWASATGAVVVRPES
jgi:CitMHS family citrate-Mg2+:H+ or citrate-Ca2+:H+ symporter